MALLVTSAVPAELKPWVAPLVKLGYAAKGIIYLLIGILALQLAMGLDGGRLTDASGVLRILPRQPFGVILLGIIGVGILAYAAWQVVAGVWDTRRKGGGWRGWISRSLTIIKGIAYGTVGWEATRIVLGIQGRSQKSREIAAGVMAFPLGDWFLALVGLGVAAYGALEVRNAWQPFGSWLLPAVAAGLACFGIFQFLHARYAKL